MLGVSRLQKLAATITPPVKPSIPSSHLRDALPKKKTRLAPAAVTNHVKVVARKAASTGSMLVKKRSMAEKGSMGSGGFYLQVMAHVLAQAEGRAVLRLDVHATIERVDLEHRELRADP